MPLTTRDLEEDIALRALIHTYKDVGCINFEEYRQLPEQEVKNRLRKLLDETKIDLKCKT